MDKRWQMAPPGDDEKGGERRAGEDRRADSRDTAAPRKQEESQSPKEAPHGTEAKDEPEREEEHQEPTRKTVAWLVSAIAVVVILALLGAGLLTLRRHRRESREAQARSEQADRGPRVLVVKAMVSPPVRDFTLPADVRAFLVTQLVAKVNGFVARVLVDKGDRVKKGQLLAEIASPETDKLVNAAESTLKANSRLAHRARVLAPAGVMTRQELDNANAQLGVSQSEVQRTKALRSYERIIAPFDGIVTQRYVDPGTLANGTTQQALFEISDASKLRVLVYAGQDIAPFLKMGDVGMMTLEQLPGVKFPGTISRLSGSLDARSRSELVELWMDNPRQLLPGLYAQVTLRVNMPQLPIVPAEAAVARGEKLLVGTLQQGNKVHFVEIQPGINDGKFIEVRAGLRGDETVALAVPSELYEGAPIQPIDEKQAAAEKQQKQQQEQQKEKKPQAKKGASDSHR